MNRKKLFQTLLSKKQRNFPAQPENSADTACIAHKSLRICERCRLGTLGLIALILTAGCGSDDKRADLVILNGAEPESIDPAVVTGPLEGRICYALFEGLLRFDRFGQPKPGLAESWNLSSDGKIYTFHLRANASWSNGDPVTATEFARSWK